MATRRAAIERRTEFMSLDPFRRWNGIEMAIPLKAKTVFHILQVRVKATIVLRKTLRCS